MEDSDERPAKRLRIAPLESAPEMLDTVDAEDDDLDDIYDSPAKPTSSAVGDVPTRDPVQSESAVDSAFRSTIPGLGFLEPSASQKDPTVQEKQPPTPIPAPPSNVDVDEATEFYDDTENGNISLDNGAARLDRQSPKGDHAPATASMSDAAAAITSSGKQPAGSVENGSVRQSDSDAKVDTAAAHDGDANSAKEVDATTERPALTGLNGHALPSAGDVKLNGKGASSEQDAEFIQVAIKNKNDPNAEWQLDSSGPESSSNSSSSDSSSSSEEETDEEGYNLLSAEEQARILMAGDGASDDEGAHKDGKAGTTGHLRTANEKPDEAVPKPNIEVTPDMRIVELGEVENIVENYVLIKAKITGETRVLESGSVICLQDRTVIGAVAETLGRVEQPRYSLAFSNTAEIEELHITPGTTVFYVEKYSHFVFTQALKLVKGSDASNIHDEEVGADEMEFSDDEAEAAYKRQRKLERAGKKAGPSANGFSMQSRRTDAMPSHYDSGRAIRYDDNEDDDDDMYTPLARPSNLSQLMTSGAPVAQRGALRGRPDRARGDRARSNRGRNDRGSRARGESSRGRENSSARRGEGFQNGSQVGRRDAHSQIEPEASMPYHVTSNNVQHYETAPPLPADPPPNYSPQTFQKPPQAAYPQQTYGWTPNPLQTAYQYAPYGQQMHPTQQWQTPSTPEEPLPAGAFVNPAFFRNQQAAAWQQPYSPNQYQDRVIQQRYAQQQDPQNQHHDQMSHQRYPQQPPPGHYSYGTQNSYGASPGAQYVSHGNSDPQAASLGYESSRQMSPESDAAFRAAQERLNLLRNLSRSP